MPQYKYLIVGGGMTADAAVRGIRKHDATGTIGIVSRDTYPPYNRPPLSKALWFGKPIENIWRGTEKFDVHLHLGRQAQKLDAERKLVQDDQGEEYAYDELLIATGSSPRRLPFGGDDIIYYRTLDDYKHLHDLADRAQRFAVIGGGFIGSEISAALAKNGKEVAIIFPENAISARAFPPDLALFLNQYYKEHGVKVYAGHGVSNIVREGNSLALTIEDARTGAVRQVEAGGIVAGVGVMPNTALAEAAGLEVGNGILVDAALQTGRRHIYAAGDVASFYNPVLDTRMRVEHEDNANTMGMAAGESMAGAQVSYTHLPYFYSDLFDLGYEAVGELRSDYQTVSDWSEPFQKGVVYYLRDGRVRGVLLWNVWGQVENARKLIAEPGPFTPKALIGRLPAPKEG